MSRRSGQNGYIEKKGSAYYVRFWIDVPGREQRVHKAVRICPVSGPGKMGKAERERRAKKIIAESGADTEQHFNAVQAINSGTTFEQQAAWWLRNIQNRKRRPVKPHTATTWAGYLRWINQRIGKMPLASVNNSTAKQLVAEMSQAEFAPKTSKGYLQVVKAVVASALREDGEPMHPRKWNHDYIDLPEVKGQYTPCFTSEQVTKIVAAKSPYRMLYALLAGTGMRINEALALEIPHISPDGSTITVKQGMWNGKVQSLKTINAYREVDLDLGLAKMLLTHIGSRKSGFVFQSSRGTPLQLAHVLCRDLHPILASVGAPKTGFHAFRRFRVTHLRKQRIPEDLLRFWIGHSDKSVTDGYSKVKEDAEFRKQVASNIPLGFQLPREIPEKTEVVVPIVPKSAFLMGVANA